MHPYWTTVWDGWRLPRRGRIDGGVAVATRRGEQLDTDSIMVLASGRLGSSLPPCECVAASVWAEWMRRWTSCAPDRGLGSLHKTQNGLRPRLCSPRLTAPLGSPPPPSPPWAGGATAHCARITCPTVPAPAPASPGQHAYWTSHHTARHCHDYTPICNFLLASAPSQVAITAYKITNWPI